MSDHLIKRQILDLRISDRRGAQRVQEQARQAYWSEIVPALEEIFSGAVPEDVVVRLDKLEIELGGVSLETFASKVVEKIRERITEQVRGNEAEIDGISSVSLSDQVTPGQEGLAIIPSRTAYFRALTIFLETGLFPWWFTKTASLSTTKLLEKALEEQPEELVAAIRRLERPGIKRLSEQFPTPLLLQLWRTAIPKRHATADMFSQLLAEWAAITPPPGVETTVRLKAALERAPHTLQKHIRAIVADAIAKPEAFTWPQKTSTITAYLLEKLTVAIDLTPREMIELLETSIRTNRQMAPLLSKYLKDTNRRPTTQTAKQAPKKQDRKESTEAETPPGPKSWQEQPDKSSADIAGAEKIEDQSRRKANGKIREELESGVLINNAGLVLLAPFLSPFFKELRLTDKGRFISETERERAVLLTQYLVTARTEIPEEQLMLNKILCGWPPEEPPAGQLLLTEKERRESEDLLQSVCKHWKALGKTSNDALRETFLQRDGKLISRDTGYKLLVQRTGVDVLLERLPWSIGYIKLPWMDDPLQVEW